ncbi:MAG: L-histidine N(alpha)-methyltransferase [Gloeomargarita sp. SKYG116]|nr:L-histidine N(alpha)-methyltransferase [Gloeomargarita sp. SKYG116]MDW8401220.1 L-histidine N(alpha)-methyltransferase [Gloeomargarita sp. SKYGB_i_bin116]
MLTVVRGEPMEYDLRHRYRCDLVPIPTGQRGADVIQGLTRRPKTLPSYYFYDQRGSELFEQICNLPEYYPTRTEQKILASAAPEIAALTGPCDLVELGSGSSRKTRLLLDAYSQLQGDCTYIPIDVSTTMLQTTALHLLADYPCLFIHALAGVYETALEHLPPSARARLLIFLGSTIGNLSPQEEGQFLRQIYLSLSPGDHFLLGVDLQKDIHVLTAAYNDSQGVTAAFNLNILRHLNHCFRGNFSLDRFTHWAFYNEELHQIEMHLVSLEYQVIQLLDLGLEVDLRAQETIRTEISRKFDVTLMAKQLDCHGLPVQRVWQDEQKWFALLLCKRV